MKKDVLYISIYFLVLLVLMGMYLYDSRKGIDHVIRVESSPWLVIGQDNLVSVQAHYPRSARHNFGNQSVHAVWDSGTVPQFDKYIVHVPMPQTGAGVFRLPEVPKQKQCVDLSVTWLKVGANIWVDRSLQKYANASAKVYCTKFGVDNVIADARSRMNWFSDGQYAPRTELALYPLSEFIPGTANEVLFVDIKDGVPYQGDIEVEPLNAPPGTMPQIVRANASGVTSLFFTLDSHGKFKITAGSDVLIVPFNPKPSAFHVAANGYLILKDLVTPSVRITTAGPPQDFIIDYYVGYAWIQRQIVPAHQLNSPIDLSPGYQFNKDEPEIVYAKIHAASGGESQVIPFVAKSYQPGYAEWVESQKAEMRDDADALKPKESYVQTRDHTAANMEFSAIIQDYVKLKMLNRIDLHENFKTWHIFNYSSLYKEIWESTRNRARQQQYEIFVVASVLNELLKKDLNRDKENSAEALEHQGAQIACIYGDECNQIRKFMLHVLGNAHQIELKEVANSLDQEQPKFEAQKRKAKYHSSMFLAGWFAVGVVGFCALARRIRNRRQTIYFEAAAHGKKQDDIPSAPFLLKVLICALGLGLLVSFYLMVSLW